MQERYLLYIDILGFQELVKKTPERVAELYKIIDSLNAHEHDAFKTIVFSDTILVYSKDGLLKGKQAHEYFVMFSCEFAQDLMYRFIGTGFSFRALLRFGEFDHYHLKHAECFYGKALVDAYVREKEIKCVGLFIDRASQRYNDIFPVARYDDELSYVFLNQATQRLDRDSGGHYPMEDAWYLDETDSSYQFAEDVLLLKEMFELANGHPHPAVRLKYLTAWNYQIQQYPKLLSLLSLAKFDPASIANGVNWKKALNFARKQHRIPKRNR